MAIPRLPPNANALTRKCRKAALAAAIGLTAPMTIALPATAAKLDGLFGGGAKSIAVSGVSQEISLAVHNAASVGCPCRGTRGVLKEKTTSSINVPILLSVKTTDATAYGDKTHSAAATMQTSTVTGLNLLAGMITADALKAVATVDATPTKLTKSDTGTTITNLVVNGTPVDPNVPDNTVLTLPGLGTVTIKAVDMGKNGQQAHESVDMLLVEVSKTNSFGLPVGAKLVIGTAKASYDRQQPAVVLKGGASGLRANADAGALLDEAAGSAASIGIPGCSGTGGKTLTKSVTNLDVPILLSIGTITNTAFGGTQGKASVASTSSTASNVSLLAGLVTATSIAAFAQESSTGGMDTPSTAGSGFAGLAIGGVPVDPNTPPNTSLSLPGIGNVIINEQLLAAKSAVQVNGLHITVTQQNILGLAVGAQVIVAHAAAVARKF